jgi:hypothetical protein
MADIFGMAISGNPPIKSGERSLSWSRVIGRIGTGRSVGAKRSSRRCPRGAGIETVINAYFR